MVPVPLACSFQLCTGTSLCHHILIPTSSVQSVALSSSHAGNFTVTEVAYRRVLAHRTPRWRSLHRLRLSLDLPFGSLSDVFECFCASLIDPDPWAPPSFQILDASGIDCWYSWIIVAVGTCQAGSDLRCMQTGPAFWAACSGTWMLPYRHGSL